MHHLVEPLNHLSVEISQAKKAIHLPESEIQQLQEEIRRFEAELLACQGRIAKINDEQRSRLRRMQEGDAAIQLLSVRQKLMAEDLEKQLLYQERVRLSTLITRDRAQARVCREAVALNLHFTGIDVRVCPSCDTRVDDEAVNKEIQSHHCRLCGKNTSGNADSSQVEAMELQATELETRADHDVRDRARLSARLASLDANISQLSAEADQLHRAVQEGTTYALPTEEEKAELVQLHEKVGMFKAHIEIVRGKLEGAESSKDDIDRKRITLGKVREVLQEVAKQRNATTLARLQVLTEDVARRIGAESITHVTCSPVGRLEFHKHGTPVRFTQLHNQGDRLRVRLAFFLALMRLGREPGMGKHPGFLLIDQLGSAEMVVDDCRRLAEALFQMNSELSTMLQVICFTARTEFASATTRDKVYGAQSGRFAF